MSVFIGIDVGGAKRGYHAIALQNGTCHSRLATCSPTEMADWCRSLNPAAIAVDAPCRWACEGKSRPAERQIYARKIHSYYTPTREIAEGRAFYDWVRNGMKLYDELTRTWPLYTEQTAARTPCVFETFPHAVTCALMGCTVSAKNKRADRTRLLREAGINLGERISQDYLDAGLCALTARHYAQDTTINYGDEASGWIILPRL